MKSVWLTYAWEDNKEEEVDYIAGELNKIENIRIKLDRWNLKAGRRLWEQIEYWICDPAKSDAWLFYATQNSLGSKNCREEYAYALDRALSKRGNDFPIIALVQGQVDTSLLPAGIRTRLYVSQNDPDWKERIASGIFGHEPDVQKKELTPYVLKIHEPIISERPITIELRPKAGTWSPFLASIPVSEINKVNPALLFGPAGERPCIITLNGYNSGRSADGKWFTIGAQNEATSTQSYYFVCDNLPSILIFGKAKGQLYIVELSKG